jgi:16S rRNA processing protein RimM
LDEFFLIAEIVSVYASDGSVVLKSFSDFEERFFDLQKVYIDFFGNYKQLKIEYVEEINGSLIIKFERFNNDEDVYNFLGKKLYISSDKLYSLPTDMFFIHDLVGSKVYRDTEFFGKLIDVIIIPNNNIYVIENDKGQQVMIPAVEKYFSEIDIENKKLILSPESEIFKYDEN